MKPRTLSGQLALAGIAWITVWALALLLAFNLLLSNVLAGQIDAALRARAQAVAATIRVDRGQLLVSPGNDDALDAGTSIFLGQQLVEGSDLSDRLRAELIGHGTRTADREALGPVRYLAIPIRRNGQQIGTIVASSDTGGLRRTAIIVGAASAGLVAMLVLFTFFALRGLIRRAMRPVWTMGDQASAWSDKDIDRRFDTAAGPTELRHLATTLNSLLERISATVRHERRVTAELSHEIRTPLSHLHAELNLLSAPGPATGPEAVRPEDLDGLLLSVRRLEALVETALAPARAVRAGAPGLGKVSAVLADLPSGRSSSATLTVTGETELVLSIEPDVARRALLPVVENAWRYAEQQIRIDVSTDGTHAVIAVSDDGGRLDPADAEAIFDPGFRSDDDSHPGAGLGLALTRRICRASGGDATAGVSDGWTTIRLHVPCLPL